MAKLLSDILGSAFENGIEDKTGKHKGFDNERIDEGERIVEPSVYKQLNTKANIRKTLEYIEDTIWRLSFAKTELEITIEDLEKEVPDINSRNNDDFFTLIEGFKVVEDSFTKLKNTRDKLIELRQSIK